MFLVATLTFFLMYLVPAGPFLSEKAPSEQTLKGAGKVWAGSAGRHPVPELYEKTDTRRFGSTSLKMRGQEVNDIIRTRFPVSAKNRFDGSDTGYCSGVYRWAL